MLYNYLRFCKITYQKNIKLTNEINIVVEYKKTKEISPRNNNILVILEIIK